MELQGEEIWTKEIPFTFHQYEVSDEGFIIGYAYSKGIYGWSRGDGDGDAIIAVLDAAGDLVFEKRFERDFRGFSDSDPHPTIDRFDVNHATNSALFFMGEKDLNRGGGKLLCINYKKQKEILNVDLLEVTGDEKGRIIDLKYIHPYPLIAVVSKREGGGFVFKTPRADILNHEREILWSWISDEDRKWYGFDLTRGESGEILFKENETKLHRVKASPSGEGWEFTDTIESIEVADEENTSEPAPEKVTELETKPIPVEVKKSFELNITRADIESTKIPFHRAFDDQENLFTLRAEENSTTFEKRNQQGEVIQSWLIEPSEDWEPGSFIWLKDNHFVFTGYQRSSESEKPFKSYKILELDSETLESIDGIKSWGLGELQSNDKGLILIRSQKSESINSGNHIRVIDESGKIIVTINEEQFSNNCGNCKQRAACLTNDNEVAVLSSFKDRIIYVDLEGNILREHYLEEIWGYNPNYLAGIYPDPDGGVYVNDFNGKYPIVRMSKEGEVLEKYTVNGVPNKLGNVWGHDGYQMFQYDSDGKIIKTIGTTPSQEAIGDIRQMVVDQNGFTYILPQQSAVIHVFDDAGNYLYKCDSGEEIETSSRKSQMTMLVYPDRTIDLLVQTKAENSQEKDKHLSFRFDSKGELKSESEFPKGMLESYGSLFFERDIPPIIHDQKFFYLRYTELQLFDAESGEVIHSQEKDFDKYWLGHINMPLQSPDGKLMVQNSIGSGFYDQFDSSLYRYTVYSKEGKPLRKQQLPISIEYENYKQTAWDGEHIFMLDQNKILMINKEGEILGHLDHEEVSWEIVQRMFVTKKGKELWLFDGKDTMTVVDITI